MPELTRQEINLGIAELEADNRECRRLLQLFLNNQGHPNLMLRRRVKNEDTTVQHRK